MLDKSYRPAEAESRIAADWEAADAFACGRPIAAGRGRFCIMIPPPNVTGSLHMGHALNNTLQDILTRFERMRGKDALWQPGTDHAGIATQMVVERMLDKEGTSRRDLGRDAFLDRVWKWKAESGGTITGQLRRLGASVDWKRERFTMDEGLSAAVRKVFVDLHKQGLIYKDKRLVNWDPKLLTAISDLEVQQKETKGHLWHIRYPVEGEDGRFITVATTRPETLLGDVAVAVHPDDERYKALVGRHAVLPLVGRRLVIVADVYADPEKGSGAVKITPAHDFNDFEVGRRAGLTPINVFDAQARINDNAPEAYRGLDRYDARKKILADLEAGGFLDKVEDNLHMVPHGDRSGVAIEPWLTDQWYVDAATLAAPAIKAVEDGRTRFVPESWTKTYYDWMRNIQPWCVSRQLWWGHQIPAWYGPDGRVFVALTAAEAQVAADAHYGRAVALKQDEDVLDTWFSSALWPFSTLGWPEPTPELARYYPNDCLVTGFDIIFFWVARMMMMGLHFLGDVPFRTVYVHALVRDASGQKMSKSKGNIIDPLDLVDKFGADALRFTLAAMAAQGRDIKLSEQRVEGYRNFATKLWNAARFCEMNGCRPMAGFDPARVKEPVNRWIVGQAAELSQRLAQAIEGYRFNDAANAVYGFAWGSFCDWYLELIKPALQDGAEAAQAAETRATAAWVLETLLHLLQPFMPFLAEDLWRKTGEGAGAARNELLMLRPWPDLPAGLMDAAAAAELDWVTRAIGAIRTVRAELNVPAGAQLPVQVLGAGAATQARLARYGAEIRRLARLASIGPGSAAPAGSVQIPLDEAVLVLPLAGVIDIAAERSRLAKEIERLGKEIGGLEKKLGNADFVARAPDEVVEENRERLADAQALRDRLAEARNRLATAA